jgi:hypothetical protein
VIALPPLLAGAVNVTVALAFPAVAVPMVGGPGTVAATLGVTLFDAADAALLPITLTALTVNVYAVPFVRPVTLIDVHGAVQVPVFAPTTDVAR